MARLSALPLEVIPSEANFVLVRTTRAPAPPADAREVWRRLADAGIAVRAFGPGALASCLRITVGTPAENAQLADTLAAIYA